MANQSASAFERAVREAVKVRGTSVLAEPQQFLGCLADLCDDLNAPEMRVMETNCDAELLAPFAEAAARGTREAFDQARKRAWDVLRERRYDAEVANAICTGLSRGIAAFCLDEQPSLSVSQREVVAPLPVSVRSRDDRRTGRAGEVAASEASQPRPAVEASRDSNAAAPAAPGVQPQPQGTSEQPQPLFCTKCGAKNKVGQNFCNACGAPLSPISASSVYCSQCGRANDASRSYCAHCGAPLAVVPAETSAAGNVATAPAAPPQNRRAKGLLVAVVGALLCVVLGAALALNLFGMRGGSQAATEQQAPEEASDATQQADAADETAEGQGDAAEDSTSDTEDAQDAEDAESTNETEEAADSDASDTEESADNAVTVQSGLAAYSWEELARIAEQIEQCDRISDALSIAQDYNLVDASGTYGTQTIAVAMTDGVTMHMRLVGIWHDLADTPSGYAGLTFLSDGIVYHHPMSKGTANKGGWEASQMRSWMSTQLGQKLPDEVSRVIIPVYKNTNNAGKTTSPTSVTATADRLWIPSIVELTGPLNWTFESNPANSEAYNAIFNSEGTQYPAFAQEAVDDFDANPILALGGEWWLRSSSPASGRGRYVGSNGDPSFFGDANENWGVVVGFCL